MALTTTYVRNSISGDRRTQFYELQLAESGDVLTTGLKVIEDISVNNNSAVTLAAPTQAAGPNSVATVTFTTTGAVSNLYVNITGY